MSHQMSHKTSVEPLVSIIIVNWNGYKWLPKLLESLQVQTYSNLEIVIVDNGSTDDSVSYLESNFPNVIQVKLGANLGFAGGNNAGVEKSTGEYVLFLNSDTWVEPDYVEGLLDELISRKLDVIAPQEANYSTRQRRERYATKIDIFGHPIFFSTASSLSQNFYLSGVSLLTPKNLYNATGGFDGDFFMYSEEVDWFWRLILQEKVFDYSREVVVYHAVAGSSKQGLNQKIFLWRNENTLRMLLKNYRTTSLLLVLPMYTFINFVEVIFFLIILKPKLAITYVLAPIRVYRTKQSLLRSRRKIQSERKVNDLAVVKRMRIIPSKIHHLYIFFLRSVKI